MKETVLQDVCPTTYRLTTVTATRAAVRSKTCYDGPIHAIMSRLGKHYVDICEAFALLDTRDVPLSDDAPTKMGTVMSHAEMFTAFTLLVCNA